MHRDETTLVDIAGAARLAQHPDVPWSLIAGMRDHLIHAYDAVDLEEVWKTASADVPGLLAQIEPLLPKAPN